MCILKSLKRNNNNNNLFYRPSVDSNEALSLTAILIENTDLEDEGSSEDESCNSEDDPNRLWCICKKPHNNRFMICCDQCEDWFHGKCVGVTKALGNLIYTFILPNLYHKIQLYSFISQYYINKCN